MFNIFKCFGNYSKIVLNKIIYKIILLPLTRGSERDRKSYNIINKQER